MRQWRDCWVGHLQVQYPEQQWHPSKPFGHISWLALELHPSPAWFKISCELMAGKGFSEAMVSMWFVLHLAKPSRYIPMYNKQNNCLPVLWSSLISAKIELCIIIIIITIIRGMVNHLLLLLPFVRILKYGFLAIGFLLLLLLQLFAYDTVKTLLTPKDGEPAKVPFPISSVAGAVAGFSSTLCVYPLELLKTRLTIQVRGSSWISFHSRFSRINQMQLLSNKCMFFCIYKFALLDPESLYVLCCKLLSHMVCMCVLHYKLLLEYNVHVYVFCKVAVEYGAAAIKYFFT